MVFDDTKTGESQHDREAFDLIMRDKERLLSFDEPTSFIFSHSALGKGWDNPNVFQICTLNQTASEMKKRQEIGRGVRLAVNQAGERVRDEQVNVLLVVANESYESYVSRYQEEVEEAFGKDGAAPRPANARKARTVKLRKEYLPKPEFKELWNRIAQKTRYAVSIDSERLIADVVGSLKTADIRPPALVMKLARVVVGGRSDAFDKVLVAERKKDAVSESAPMPNLVEVIASLLERTTPPMRLTRRTLLEILKRTTRMEDARLNPHEFANVTAQIIRRHLAAELVDGIQYEKINEWYDQTLFKTSYESWESCLVKSDRAIYTYTEVDSRAADPTQSIEGKFVQGLEARDDVKLYFKLPGWLTVDTPIGRYNPDWAVVREPRDEFGHPTGEQLLYLVRETKDTLDLENLSTEEQRKIHCGKRHFTDALGVDYRVVTNASEI